MRFAPQRCAHFWHLNAQNWSEHVLLLTCWLGNVLRAMTAFIVSIPQLPKVAWRRIVFNILTWKCCCTTTVCILLTSQLLELLRSRQLNFHTVRNVLCPNCMQFFISPLAAGSAPAALGKLLVDAQNQKSLLQHGVSRLSFLFVHLHLLCDLSLIFSSLIFLFS